MNRKFVAAASFALLVAAMAPAETRRAVVIGINTYAPEKGAATAKEPGVSDKPKRRGTWVNLDGAVNDAQAIAEVLKSRYEFQDVVLITEAKATRERILDAIKQHLVDPVQPGDVSVLYYAGHGSQMLNSKSAEVDKLDETIVPVDAAKGVVDIRDKELSRLLNDMLAKKAIVTAIFDSCHSGSVTRGFEPGKVRTEEPSEFDAATLPPVDPGPPPETKGALVITAALDYQSAQEVDDEGTHHGLFTASLLRALRTTPRDASAADVFGSLRSIMHASLRAQEPVIAATADRQKLPLFGVAAVAHRPRVSVRPGDDPGKFIVEAGFAAGLSTGAELKQVTAEKGAQPVVLRIDSVNGPASSAASAVSGNGGRVQAGALFEIDKAAPEETRLRVWWPSDGPSMEQIAAVKESLAALAKSNQVTWLSDPTQKAPAFFVRWTAGGWKMLDVRSGLVADLGAQPAPAAFLNRATSATAVALKAAATAATDAEPPAVFVDFPPPLELVRAIQLGDGTRNSSVVHDADVRSAQYVLEGRLHGERVEYAWVVPNVIRSEARNWPLPLTTTWLPLSAPQASADGSPSDPVRSLASKLEDFALTLGKVRMWRELAPPVDDGRFPFRLYLKNIDTGALVRGGSVEKVSLKRSLEKTGFVMGDPQVRDGERFTLVLKSDAPIPAENLVPRWVYVFAIDSVGNSWLLFPPAGNGNVENQIPPKSFDAPIFPAEVDLGHGSALFSIGPACNDCDRKDAFGVDTYFLLTTQQPISNPDQVFNFTGVIRSGTRSAQSPLEALLQSASSGTRAPRPVVPTNWSIEKLSIQSVAKP